MTGISRYDAAVAIGRMFGTEPYHIRSYDSWCVKDSDGKTWKFSRDSSIDCERLANGTVIDADGDYSTEMVSPKLEYSEMGKLQEVVRCVKNAGAFVNSSCGMHVHVDASNHTPRSLKNALTIMYCKEDILFKALNVQTRREDEYCQKVRPMVVEKIRRMPNSTITMEKFKRAWYEGNDGSSEHYNWTRYYALNLHAVFPREHWNGVVLKAPSMQEKSGQTLRWHLPYPHRRSTSPVPMPKRRRSGITRHLHSVPFAPSRTNRGRIQKCAEASAC